MGKYFLYFVRERLIRDLLVFRFQIEGQPLRTYNEQVFGAAGSLQNYEFHPSILDDATFLDKPRSLKELYYIVGLIEELSAAKEWHIMKRTSQLSGSGSWLPECVPFCSGAIRDVGECIVGMLGLWPVRPFQTRLPQKSVSSGNGGRRVPGSRS